MNEHDRTAGLFQTHRDHLHGVAYRMLGSVSEAEDAVQEAWIRLSRADVSTVDNLAGWLATVVARVCLDMLRSRAARREHTLGRLPSESDAPVGSGSWPEPEQEAQLAESVGRALLVVLDTLAPAERIALVLHDVFAVPFAEIAPIVARTPAATKKLAGRARLKVRAGSDTPRVELARHRRVVEAFLAAARTGDVPGLLAVLAPDVVRRADRTALPAGVGSELRGAARVAEEIRILSGPRAHAAEPALVNGAAGAVVTRGSQLVFALRFTIEDGRIVSFDVLTSRVERLAPWPSA
jgi:RNA polymerase sigma factor (sigma-70 family)